MELDLDLELEPEALELLASEETGLTGQSGVCVDDLTMVFIPCFC